MRRKLLILLVSSALIACTQADEGSPTAWESLQLPGKTLTLIDAKKLEVFPFSADGTTAATVGTQDAMAGPIFFWKIKGNVLIISELADSEVFEELGAPSVNGNFVTATQKSGTKARYTLTKSGA